MRRRKNKDIVFTCILLLLVGSLLYQGYQLLKPNEVKKDASQMLYQVVHFQMEILNSSLMEAIHMNNTKELDRVKLAAYSANFGHERMVRAFGKDELDYLPAVDELVNMITGWQIAGDRSISQQERDLLVAFSSKFAEIIPVYGILVNNNHQVNSVQAEQLSKLSKQLDDLISR
ncbi:hypothetical protein ACP8HI_15630 [Paenibacillus sp. FA6]|uniref:hypothetical protein n=1 Tax=Paenibacillus sp. FA6 TaxID=3413029 RepID=UPI003F65EF67